MEVGTREHLGSGTKHGEQIVINCNLISVLLLFNFSHL